MNNTNIKKTRSQNTMKNIYYSFFGQLLGLFVSFILRMVFVKQLSGEYLGIDSLFTSIVTMLSLAELGIGSAINFSLYRPLSENDTEKIKSLMFFYKKIYRVVGISIFIIGTGILPFIVSSVSKQNQIQNISIIFFIFVLNSSISYFYSYKKTLIIADQHRHITIIYKYIFYVLMVIIQSIVLLVWKNYIIFLLIMLCSTFLENYTVSKKADNLYPFLKEKDYKTIDSVTKKQITKNAYAMSFHKIGGVVINSTDNIFISKVIGIATVGLYSNYLLITNSLNVIISQIFNSIIASVGNLGVEEDEKKLEEVFNFTFFCCYLIVSFSVTMLATLVNPFIELWIGEQYILPMSSMFFIVSMFYVLQIRKAVLTFRDALGLYWYDRYKPIVESILNIVFSITFSIKFGLNGVFMGTILSQLFTSIWIEPYVLYKYGFHSKLIVYFKKLVQYTLYTIITLAIVYNISIYASVSLHVNDFIKIIIIGFLSVSIYILITLILNMKNKNLSRIFNYIIKRKNKV